MLISKAWALLGSPIPLDMLQRMYSNPNRLYHNWNHITEGVEFLTVTASYYFDRLEQDDRGRLLAAWMTHDAIYDVASKQNEEDSATFAWALWHDDQVSEAIRCTKTHEATGVDWVDMLLDADSARFASDQFSFHSGQIIVEYSHLYETETIVKGRIAFLEQTLAKKYIFATQSCYERYEAKARENIAKEIERLKSFKPSVL